MAPQLGIPRVCRNFEAVRGWGLENRVRDIHGHLHDALDGGGPGASL